MEVLGEIGYSTPMVYDKPVPLLDWHYWQVRVKAARVPGKIRRNIPDLAIKRLVTSFLDLHEGGLGFSFYCLNSQSIRRCCGK